MPWAPDKILCRPWIDGLRCPTRRWGVAEPRPGGFGDREEEPKSRHQRKYNEQVKAKETGKAAQAARLSTLLGLDLRPRRGGSRWQMQLPA